HDHEDEHEAHLTEPHALPERERAPADALNGKEHEVSAVEHGDGQQVEHGEVDGEQRHEVEEALSAVARDLTAQLADEDGPAEVPRRLLAGDHLPEELHGNAH